MSKLLCNVVADIFVPFYFQVSKYLETKGYEVSFVSFSLRENLWLKKNNVVVQPADISNFMRYPIKPGVISPQEIEAVIDFAILKFGGSRVDLEKRAQRIAAYLQYLIDENKYDAALIWNGEDFMGKILALLCKRANIKTIFIENGYFPRTLQIDHEGVNVYSSLARRPFKEIHGELESTRHKHAEVAQDDFALSPLKGLSWLNYFLCFWIRILNLNFYKDFPELRGVNWFVLKWMQIKRRFIPLDKIDLPGKYVFIPFQVHDDTQILLNSKYFKNMEDFFEFVYKSIKKHFGNDYAIVVKEHPEDLCRYSYSRLRMKYSDVIWLRKYDINEVLDRASYVFVINSSVGLQAVERKKPVIVFGDSFYTRDEIVFCVKDPKSIDTVIERAKMGIDEDRRDNIENFIKYLKVRYFIDGSWKDITKQGIVNSGNKILSLIS